MQWVAITFYTGQTLFLWPHNHRRRVRAGEVCDTGESEWDSKAWKPNISHSTNITKWMSKRMERITGSR